MQSIDQIMISKAWDLDPEGVYVCINLGADVNAQDDLGMTCAHYASMSASPESIEILRLLLSTNKVNLEIANDRGRTPLDLAKDNYCDINRMHNLDDKGDKSFEAQIIKMIEEYQSSKSLPQGPIRKAPAPQP